jgi:hypothetical protein
MKRIVSAAMCALLLCSASPAAPARKILGTEMMGYVKSVEGKSDAGRHAFIERMLKTLGVPFDTISFDAPTSSAAGAAVIHGQNIIVHMGQGREKIVLGAHVDAVTKAPGANDNGSGVAVVLEIIKNSRAHHFSHAVDFCFFDREEDGLVGSAVYVRTRDTSFSYSAMINLDVEGTGEEIYVGSVEPGRNDALMKYVRAARDSTRYPYSESEHYPESDHESFNAAGLQNISISVVAAGDGAKLTKWVESGFAPINNPADMPVVLKVMHTPEDKSIYMTPDALEKSYTFTWLTLRGFDGGGK